MLQTRVKYQSSSEHESVNGKGSTLADLYDPLTMPADLHKAHQTLDMAVERCYRKSRFKSDPERLGFLFERYRDLSEKQKTA